MNAIAREYALDLSDGAFEPSLVQHLPGVINVIADVLSRRLDPKYSQSWVVPPLLANARHERVPPRNTTWWRASHSPGGAKNGNIWGEQS